MAKKQTKTLLALVVAVVMAFTVLANVSLTALAYEIGDGKYYVQYDSYDDTIEGAKAVAEKVAAEGNVLMKNENAALPLDKHSEGVSLFGVSSDAMPYAVTGGSGVKSVTLADALKQEGFRVNPVLKAFYDKNTDGAGTRKETVDFGASVESSYGNYKDVAIVVWGVSAGGEGYGDASPATKENDVKGAHKNSALDANGNPLKHELQMNDAELALKDYVESQGFKKVIYIVASWAPVEIGQLVNDENVDGILWVGAPGVTGNLGTAKILSGSVSPSGKTVDTWYSDFTADPTWANLSNGAQHAVDEDDYANRTYIYDQYGNAIELDGSGILSKQLTQLDYEEDIYVGYRYYETAAYEASQGKYAGFNYADAVTYPFGYGLSYTTFKYSDMSVKLDNGEALSAITAAKLKSDSNAEAQVKSGVVTLTVTNTGAYAGKEVVQLYASAPYTGAVEKSHVVLIGFAKTSTLQPGQSQKVEIEFNFQDIASYDAEGKVVGGKTGYVLEAGNYTLMATANAHGWADTASETYQQATFALSTAANMELDDYSGNQVENLFSAQNGMYNTVRTGGNGRYDVNMSADDGMTMMKRSDFVGTFPKANTKADQTYNQQALMQLYYWSKLNYTTVNNIINGKDHTFNYVKYDADNKVTFEEGEGGSSGSSKTIVTEPVTAKVATVGESKVVFVDKNNNGTYEEGTDIFILDSATDLPWLADFEANKADMVSWTQSTEPNQTPTIKIGDKTITMRLGDLTGLDPDSNEAVPATSKFYVEGAATQVTQKAVWTAFLNSYTFEELDALVNVNQKKADDSKGMFALGGADNCHNFGSTFEFGANANLAATWNTQLAYEQGNIFGNICRWRNNNAWWGTGFQIHRHYFAGRNHEYFAEDPMLVGIMASAEIRGAHVTGANTIIKHAMLNDQETNRGGACPLGWISEQAFREIYLKPFQMGFQEGGAQAVMTSMSRIGRIVSGANWNFQEALIRTEWGCKNVSCTTDIYISVQDAGSNSLYVMAGTDNLETSRLTFQGTWKDGKLYNKDTDLEDMFQWYSVRKMATKFLDFHANTGINNSGIYFSDWTLTDAVEAKQGTEMEQLDVATYNPGEGYDVSYTLSGALPRGLAFDGTTISGTPLEAGVFEVEITCIVNKVYTSTKKITITVEDTYSTAISAEVATEISESINETLLKDVTDTVTCKVISGKLPEGIAIENGYIVGTPTTAGEYEFTVELTIGETTYTLTVTLAVDSVFYNVKFNTNGGSALADETVEHGETVAIPTIPTKEGYTFIGWYRDEACSAAFNFDKEITSDTTLYAGWIKNAPEQTPVDPTPTPTPAEPEKSGCNGVVAASSIGLMVGVAAAAVCFVRKKKEQ